MTEPNAAPTTPAAPAAPAGDGGPDVAAAVAALRASKGQPTAAPEGASKAAPEQERAPVKAPEQSPAKEPQTPTAPQASTVEIAPDAALKTRLRADLAARRREVEEQAARIAAQDAELKSRAKAQARADAEFKAREERIRRLERLKDENPEEFFKETGFSLDNYIKKQLAARDPKQQAVMTEQMLADLPKLIEAEAKKQAEAILKSRDESTQKQAQERQAVELRRQAERAVLEGATRWGETALPNGEKTPLVSALAKRNPAAVVALAHTTADLFRQENHRQPTLEEVVYNIERDLRGSSGGETETNGRPPAGTRGTPRSNAKEVAEKPIEEMSERERMNAAVKALKQTKADDASSRLTTE